MDYGNLLSRSWRVVWDHKFMIILGFLAALGSGLGSNGNNFNYTADSGDFQNMPFVDAPFSPPDPAQFLPVLGAMAAGAFCFALILGIALWILRLTAEAGLIDAASRLDAAQKLSFGEAMSAGWQKIWRMVGLSLLVFGMVAVVILGTMLLFALGIGGTIAGAANSSGDMGGLFAALGAGLVGIICCLICVFAVLAILVNIIYTFAQRAIVLEDLGVIDGIKRGWQVIKDNLGEVIILLILFFLLGFVVSAIIAMITIPLGALSFGPGAMRIFSGEALSGLDVFLMVVGGFALVLIIAAIRSFFVAFRSSAFTLAFQEFTDKNLPPQEFAAEKLPPTG